MDSHTFGYIVATAILIVPALAISARIALGPILDAMARRRADVSPALEQRLLDLETSVKELRDENSGLREEVLALRSAEAFYRELRSAPEGTAPR